MIARNKLDTPAREFGGLSTSRFYDNRDVRTERQRQVVGLIGFACQTKYDITGYLSLVCISLQKVRGASTQIVVRSKVSC